ncbi:hypothetical protein [Mucilaginibacter flavus]|uniref:hypothetical protein n=1 Tax=Mucilaginibacter flavus TaxID=931504 RepID=UPI0025B34BF1|nr:hypothetical protein [Mucilaginibacter flavus]MDN3582730.1 hypothetical protein [Mucilaginibacter flavus]
MSTVLNNPQSPAKDNSAQIMQFLKIIEQDANHSHEMASVGAYTQLAQYIDVMVSNPLQGYGQTLISSSDNLKNVLKFIVESFFKTNSIILDSVFHSKNGFLEYYVILKKDNTKNRNSIFEFLRQYDALDISNMLPIHFSFLPEAAKTLQDIGEKLELN